MGLHQTPLGQGAAVPETRAPQPAPRRRPHPCAPVLRRAAPTDFFGALAPMEVSMKVVIVKPPKFLGSILRKIFKIKA